MFLKSTYVAFISKMFYETFLHGTSYFFGRTVPLLLFQATLCVYGQQLVT